MLRRPFMVVLVSLLLRVVAMAQAPQLPKWSARVMVDVGGEERIKNALVSYLSRELRALGDITVTDKDPEYLLDIISVPNQSADGSVLWGYTLSIVVLRAVNPTLMDTFIQGKVGSESLKSLHDYYRETFHLLVHLIKTGGSNKVEDMCKRTVTDVDAKYFEPDRKYWQSLMEQITPKKD